MRIQCVPSKLKLPIFSFFFSSISNYQFPSSKFTPFSSYFTLFLGKDVSDITTCLSRAVNLKSLVLGMQVHGRITKLGSNRDIFTQNKLIEMYSRCGILNNGLMVFDEMSERNLVSWTLLISSAAWNEEPILGLKIFLDMRRNGFVPNEFAIGSVFKICINLSAYEMGRAMHCYMVKVGMENNPFVSSSMLSLYAKLGCIEEAEHVFSCTDSVDVGCWNAMIGGYAECNYGVKAMETVAKLQAKGVCMDEVTFINALKSCSLVGDVKYGKQLHGMIICSHIQFNISLLNALIDMYLKTGGMDSAWKLFDMQEEKDIITWNTMFGGFSEGDAASGLVGLFHKFMVMGMKPSRVTFLVLFRCCGDIHNLNLGLQFCCLALHFGFFTNSDVTNSIIGMFSRCGATALAHSLIGRLFEDSINGWNELISGYNINHCYAEALVVICYLWDSGLKANEYTFSNILESCCGSRNEKMGRQVHGAIVKLGFPSCGYLSSSLVKLYATFGKLVDALRCLTELKQSDVICWGTLITTLIHHGYSNQAIISLKSLMKFGEHPDEFIIGGVFNGCADVASYLQTKSIHSLATKMGYDRNKFVASAIIDAYAKCGEIGSARMAFDQSSRIKDVIIYNTLIMAYAHNGLMMEAMEIFEKMKLANVQPSQATFVTIISACSHMGFLDQGCALFQSMKSHYGMEPSPDIYGCVVDMLSRNGLLEDAKSLIEVMPFPPWPGIIRSLLSGSRLYGNIDLSKWAYWKLHEFVPENDSAHVLLSKVYSEAGSWEDAALLQKHMVETGISKCPGNSWIQAQ